MFCNFYYSESQWGFLAQDPGAAGFSTDYAKLHKAKVWSSVKLMVHQLLI